MAKCFDDVLLFPQYSEVRSRKDVELGSLVLPLSGGENRRECTPLIASPMDTVVNPRVARLMDDLGGFAVLHRYNTVEQQVSSLTQTLDKPRVVGCAIGVTGDYQERAKALIHAGAKLICVDIAHGHHALMKQALTWLRNELGDSIHLMAGNVATAAGFDDLASWGANSIRVGIGGGSVCTTRIRTGHGIPTLESILDAAQHRHKAYLIADGGIRNSGDIVKALAAGAHGTMLGYLLAGHVQSPGDLIRLGDNFVKEYRGMASASAQTDWRGVVSVEEGVTTTVPFRGDLETTIQSLYSGIQSGCSYSGAYSVARLYGKAQWIDVSHNGLAENHPHASR